MSVIRRNAIDPRQNMTPFKGRKHSLHVKDGKRGWVDDKGNVRYDDEPEQESAPEKERSE